MMYGSPQFCDTQFHVVAICVAAAAFWVHKNFQVYMHTVPSTVVMGL